MEYNGGFAIFKELLIIKNTRDMAEILQNLSHKICSIISPTFARFALQITYCVLSFLSIYYSKNRI